MKLFKVALVVLGLLSFLGENYSFAQANDKNSISALSDNEIRELMIARSISNYSGSCPCPYNRARNGSNCGKRSAYSKPGGYSPLCYKSDISDEMVEEFRLKTKINRSKNNVV